MSEDELVFSVEGLDGGWYGVDYDQRNFTVVRLHVSKTGERSWKTVKGPYFGSLAAACRRLMKLGLADTTAQSLAALTVQMEAWCQRVECAARGEAFTGVKPTHTPRLSIEDAARFKKTEPVVSNETTYITQDGHPPRPAWMQPDWTPPKEVPPWMKNS